MATASVFSRGRLLQRARGGDWSVYAATVRRASIVSLAAEDVEWARQRAERDETSLSAVLTEALRRQRQSEARQRLLAELGTDDLTPADIDAARAERR